MSAFTLFELKTKCAKPKDDIIMFVYRNLFSWPIVLPLSKTSVTPNQVTLMSLFCAVLSGFFYSQGVYSTTIAGAVFLQFSFILDLVDGDLSRAKNMSSDFGAWMDIVLDVICYAIVHLGIVLGVYKSNGNVEELMIGFAGSMGIVLIGSLNANRVLGLEKNSRQAKKQLNQFVISKRFYVGYTGSLVLFTTLATLFSSTKYFYLFFVIASPFLIFLVIFRVYKAFFFENA